MVNEIHLFAYKPLFFCCLCHILCIVRCIMQWPLIALRVVSVWTAIKKKRGIDFITTVTISGVIQYHEIYLELVIRMHTQLVHGTSVCVRHPR